MAFSNRIRLPFYLTRPQFPEERSVFRKADGTTRVLSVVIRKTYEGKTDDLPEEVHERLKIALAHDSVTIEDDRYLGQVAQDGDYQINWNEFLDYPLGKAEFTIQVTPFDYSNSNCQTCEEASQLSLEDDYMTGMYEVLDEGNTYEYNVFENDTICCKPITAEIVSYDDIYVASVSIDAASGVATVELNPTTPSANNVRLFTYRVTCPNGSYDDADVFANIEGSEESECLAPTSIEAVSITSDSATINWTAPSPAPSDGYQWYLFEFQALPTPTLIPISNGVTTDTTLDLTGLNPDTTYYVLVHGKCGESLSPENAQVSFDTVASSTSCGKYRVFYNDGTGIKGNSTDVQFTDCNGEQQEQIVFNLSSRIICALQNSPGDPVDIVGATTITYISLC